MMHIIHSSYFNKIRKFLPHISTKFIKVPLFSFMLILLSYFFFLFLIMLYTYWTPLLTLHVHLPNLRNAVIMQYCEFVRTYNRHRPIILASAAHNYNPTCPKGL